MNSYEHGRQARLDGKYRVLANPSSDADLREWHRGWDDANNEIAELTWGERMEDDVTAARDRLKAHMAVCRMGEHSSRSPYWTDDGWSYLYDEDVARLAEAYVNGVCDSAVECGKYEVQLQAAAQHLENALAIGQVKHIGLMEVVSGIDQLAEERDELRSALCIARANALQQHGMTLRKFSALCGHSPTWVSRWTAKDCDSPPDIVCRR